MCSKVCWWNRMTGKLWLNSWILAASECSDNVRDMQVNKDHKGWLKWETQCPGATGK